MTGPIEQDPKIRKRVRRLRIIGYSITGIFTLWLIISAVVSIGIDLRSGDVTDPFTRELVVPTPDEP